MCNGVLCNGVLCNGVVCVVQTMEATIRKRAKSSCYHGNGASLTFLQPERLRSPHSTLSYHSNHATPTHTAETTPTHSTEAILWWEWSVVRINAEGEQLGHHGNPSQLLEAELVIWDLSEKIQNSHIHP